MSSPYNSLFPAPDVLNDLEYGKFVLANLAAKRAKQLKEGAPPLVVIDSKHPLSIALAEIAAGKIRPVLNSDPDAAIDVSEATPLEDSVGNELGILLPALDESEAELLGVNALVGDEHEEHDEAETGANISDLLDDEAAVEVVADSDDDTVSLDELASEEESAAGEDAEAEV